jgi:chemotaxis protein CheX
MRESRVAAGGIMDEVMAEPFRAAAERTFKEMFGLEARMSGTSEIPASDDHGWEMTGLVGLAGQAHGVVAIRLTFALVDKLLAGTGVASAGGDEKRQLEGGLVGEMINIIAGQAVSSLRGLDVEIAPPVVVRGPNHKIGWPAIAPVIALSFALPEGDFELALCIRR